MSPTKGVITIGENRLADLTDAERALFRRKSIGVIFQKLNLISHLTVAENVALAGGGEAAVKSALAAVGLSLMANVQSSLLSGGEQQRVAVARILAQGPELILADEPTSSLDDANAKFVIDALRKVSEGKTLLVVSHDDRLRREFSDVRQMEDL